MKALLVARKSLVEMLREPQLPILVVLLPLVFLLIIALTYNTPLLVTHSVLVLDPAGRGKALIEELQAQHYDDGRPMFDVSLSTDRQAAQAALKEHAATALLIIEPGDPLQITLAGDALYGRFYRASTIVNDVVRRYGDLLAQRPQVARVVQRPLVAAGPQTEFDL
ncbi:MAG: hypothetical protein GY824_22400 [Delftia sp.]|nr:hypothetical protein [Delftia sp.]